MKINCKILGTDPFTTFEVTIPHRQSASPTSKLVVAFLLLACSGTAQIPQNVAGETANQQLQAKAAEPINQVLSLSDSTTHNLDVRRDDAIAAFTKRQQEANYPSLFEKAAQEFRVPVDILEGIAFAETRWEHLTWPDGETSSLDTGRPRPYGIMSLWDNQYFGHSLIEAAALLGESPEMLKKDPYTNIRGAAALLRHIYDATQRPEGTIETDIASWRNAIAVYCGIPQPELNQQLALDIYEHISIGYHQYGIEWNGQPVNMKPIRAAVKKIQERERLHSQSKATSTRESPQEVTTKREMRIASPSVEHANKRSPSPLAVATGDSLSLRSIRLGIIALALAGLLGWMLRQRKIQRKIKRKRRHKH
jgi:hypothetical protein